ncbi:MAG: cbb3-type cytochrome oxidase assembly protein CcoS, partial [Deltaproteobacteria bacterium]|nr:cbb3-type cytochrome oxidase assembly protein CcoS [Deltaproteobacteria bacterium]
MYYPFFIIYLIAGLAVTLWALWWALRNGQFKDQQRARFLPLDEEG